MRWNQIGRIRRAQHLPQATPRAFAPLVVASIALGSALGARAQLVHPTPPRYIAEVPDLPKVPGQFTVDRWLPWSFANDGTVYGMAEGLNGKQMYKAKIGQPGEWLWPDEPLQDEWLPVSANIDGYVVLEDSEARRQKRFYGFVFDPARHRPRDVRNLHPTGFFSNVVNDQNVIGGAIGFRGGGDLIAATYSPAAGFTEYPDASLVSAISPTGSVVGVIDYQQNQMTLRVWHLKGGHSDFVVPFINLAGVTQVNSRDEVVGTHNRLDDAGHGKFGGWKWSRESGFLEIPFLYHGETEGRDVSIYGITEDGWVFGNQPHDVPDEGTVGHFFLWREDAGFFDLADLYPWDGEFWSYGMRFSEGAVNTGGQLVIEGSLLKEDFVRAVVLSPTITPMLLITPDPLIRNTDTLFTIREGNPDSLTGVFYSLDGRGETEVPELDVTLQIENARPIAELKLTDDFGDAEWLVRTPGSRRARLLWFQVAQDSGHMSVPILTQIN